MGRRECSNIYVCIYALTLPNERKDLFLLNFPCVHITDSDVQVQVW